MDPYKHGMEVMREHLGPDADKYIEAHSRRCATFCKNKCGMRIWRCLWGSKRGIRSKTRELCTIAALTVLGHGIAESLHSAAY